MEEAELAISRGASAIGLVSEMPSGPGVIPEDRIAEIAESVPHGIDTFLLTSLRRVEEIVRQHRRCRTTSIQLVDTLVQGSHLELNEALPEAKIVQVIHVTGKESLQQAVETAPLVDALLLDSGKPGNKIKELGGTGRTHDWRISRTIVRRVEQPVYLAGGLDPDNISDAVRAVQPWGVDVCSGLRTDGKLDRGKLDRFFTNLRRISQYSEY